MDYIYPIFISFILIFLSELGDKTQLLVLSFTQKQKTTTILLGVALGSLLSHGLAIIFGSTIGTISNSNFHSLLKIFTYTSFILMGVFSILPNRKEKKEKEIKNNFLFDKFPKFLISPILIIALTIAIGEFGDKTFLASIGLGIQYSNYKLFLIIGAILGMIFSDLLAIFLGKFLNNKLSENTMQKISGILFLIFGILGFIS